ncbi:MAG: helicase C-terminal domain-containing protein, partial [Candidatus Eisenbacteria bacterium]
GGILLAEAPTGVGKSLGYLVPALLWSRRQREPVVVSTHTKQLQNQLTDVDAPRLAALLDTPPRVVRLKGRANYLCPRRWRLYVADHKKRGRGASVADRRVAEWVEGTSGGDLDEFDFGILTGGPALRARIACEPSFCNPGACRTGECPWRRARQRAASADIVVVNHALLVTGLPGSNVLPPFRALVVDEAHHLDAVVTAQATVRQSLGRLDALLTLVHGERPGRGRGQGAGGADLIALVLAGAEGRLGSTAQAELRSCLERLAAVGAPMHEAARAFFAQVADSLDPTAGDDAYEPRARFRQVEEVVGQRYDALERLFTLGKEGEACWQGALSCLARAEATPEMEELAGDVGAALGAWQEWQSGLRFLTDPRDTEFVYWRGGARAESAELAAAPVDVARRVQQGLLPELTSLVLTSATLTTGGSFRYVRDRLGLTEDVAFTVTETVYPSPFDFARQLGAWVLDPPGGEAGALDAIVRLAGRLRRNTLALFTSHLALQRAARHLGPALEGVVPVWAQGPDGTPIELAHRFRAARGALLLGTSSFWEGVDFPGEALEALVVTRLPFAVPTDPLVQARAERIDATGESSFARATVPEAVLRFRQGVGRLLRRRTDRGALVILDPRIVHKGYGAQFRRGLPVALRVAPDVETLVTETASFLERTTEGEGTR